MSDAVLRQVISFPGCRANDVFPADINGDGRIELLPLQSPGCYQSDIFDGTRWAVSGREKRIFCLTAMDRAGRRLWQYRTSELGVPAITARLKPFVQRSPAPCTEWR